MDVSDKLQRLEKMISPEETTALKVTLILVIVHTKLTWQLENMRGYGSVEGTEGSSSLTALHTIPCPPYHIPKELR